MVTKCRTELTSTVSPDVRYLCFGKKDTFYFSLSNLCYRPNNKNRYLYIKLLKFSVRYLLFHSLFMEDLPQYRHDIATFTRSSLSRKIEVLSLIHFQCSTLSRNHFHQTDFHRGLPLTTLSFRTLTFRLFTV